MACNRSVPIRTFRPQENEPQALHPFTSRKSDVGHGAMINPAASCTGTEACPCNGRGSGHSLDEPKSRKILVSPYLKFCQDYALIPRSVRVSKVRGRSYSFFPTLSLINSSPPRRPPKSVHPRSIMTVECLTLCIPYSTGTVWGTGCAQVLCVLYLYGYSASNTICVYSAHLKLVLSQCLFIRFECFHNRQHIHIFIR